MAYQVRSQQGDTVDAICYRVFGTTQKVTELTLAINPNIASLGAVLPENTIVNLPKAPARIKPQTVSLWS